MATRDTGQGAKGVSRRGFLKTAAAASAVVGCGLDFAFDAEKALAYEGDTANYQITNTTCPYCSASCGQRVVKALTGANAGKIVDIYGDFESVFNSGGLCSKGSGSLQLVNNDRRIGAWPAPHPVKNMNGVADDIFAYDAAYPDGVAYMRTGNLPWAKVGLTSALDDIATRLVAARGDIAAHTASVFTAGETIGTQVYTGFGGLDTVAKADGSYFVLVQGTKVTPAALAAAMGTADPVQILACFDELIFSATDPAKRSTYTLVAQRAAGAAGTIASMMLAQTTPAMPQTASLQRSGSTYTAFVCDTTGQMHRLTSTNMTAWTYVDKIASPTAVVDAAATTGIQTPAVVVESATKFHVYSNRYTGALAEDNRLFYSMYDSGVWTGPTVVTYDGVASTNFDGHPFASLSGKVITLLHAGPSGGLVNITTAPLATPGVCKPNVVISDPTGAVGNINPTPAGVAYTTYPLPDATGGLGYAFANVDGYLYQYNSKNVAFFGSSHINNEPNYVYRKLIANFGTSNVEHQARI